MTSHRHVFGVFLLILGAQLAWAESDRDEFLLTEYKPKDVWLSSEEAVELGFSIDIFQLSENYYQDSKLGTLYALGIKRPANVAGGEYRYADAIFFQQDIALAEAGSDDVSSRSIFYLNPAYVSKIMVRFTYGRDYYWVSYSLNDI